VKVQIIFIFILSFFTYCGKLQSDETISFPLKTVSKAYTPATEEIRNFIHFDDLIYTAAGSGGILVYRIIGDTIEPILSLSLTNLYSENLETLYVRTIELLETKVSTNLIFSYDTRSGGGIGVAEVTPGYTKPLGSFKTYPNLRIRQTVTSYDPSGKFHILAADEGIGILSYTLSFESNNFFEQEKIASLVDYISYSEVRLPNRIFSALGAPGIQEITNISQITNIAALTELAENNREIFSEIITNIPFLSKDMLSSINKIIVDQDKTMISNVLGSINSLEGVNIINKVLKDPQLMSNIINSGILTNLRADSSIQDIIQGLPKGVSKNLLKMVNIKDISSLIPKNNNLPIDQINKIQNMQNIDLQNTLSIDSLKDSLANTEQNINTLTNLSPLEQFALSSNKNVLDFLNNPSMDKVRDPKLFSNQITNKETETLYAEAYLSNLNILAQDTIDVDTIHDTKYNPFTNRQNIGDAGLEIEKTIRATGRKYFIDENSEIKERLNLFTQDELKVLFQALFQQANLIIKLVPLFSTSGVDIQEIYKLWKDQLYFEIIDRLDSSILAELLRLLPRYKIDTTFKLENTNTILPGIRRMVADTTTLYIAAGMNGLYIIDRISGKILSSHKKPFSEVTMITPHEVYGKKYIIVTDTLDGLLVYQRKHNNKIGDLVSRIALIGETYGVLPYEDILWVADGADGVLGVRINKDGSLIIEAENYNKDGIAYYIGSARRREVLASYGADGLMRLRITNILPDQITKQNKSTSRLDRLEKEEFNDLDFVDKTLEWGRYSPIARFISKLFFY